ncbi:hypothetical protein LINPERHAP1_LOCUS30854 [Linum perenne]
MSLGAGVGPELVSFGLGPRLGARLGPGSGSGLGVNISSWRVITLTLAGVGAVLGAWMRISILPGASSGSGAWVLLGSRGGVGLEPV